ncbi:hypothetical protein [Nonomuraea sp. SYSU D8015]|uniref:hypothetical protein n=1 Tax=Nonomuraea sp. SYSU D8015 TaxID=2593644 RepID=UPI00166187F0|nr:hypothetical protein [Nonomuraea sp. SYSU D8015]
MFRLRRWLGYGAIAFAVFYLFTRPAQAAGAVNGVFDGILNGANQLAVFFGAVLS